MAADGYAQERALGLECWSGLAASAVFLFLTFPFGTLQARVLSEFIRATGWDIRAASGLPVFPLPWSNGATSPGPSRGATSIPVQLMRLNVGVFGLLMGHQTVDALMQFPGGGQAGEGDGDGHCLVLVVCRPGFPQGPRSSNGSRDRDQAVCHEGTVRG